METLVSIVSRVPGRKYGTQSVAPAMKQAAEKECNTVLKLTEAELAKKYPDRYPLVGSCEQYR